MKTASVTELKAHLSRYVRMAQRGSEVQILERGVPIARLVGLGGALRGGDKQRVQRLAKMGILRPGTGDLSWVLAEPPIRARGAELSRAVDEDREDRV
ncbi:MAG TPA: type II toxin-antitoxin system prevent-host-death family antitoxin [Polyangiaceae bacterium]|jgi:prevent-host-death family protein